MQADEAEATYRTCIADATTQQLDLEHTKVNVLRQLQDLIKQSDQTLRSVRPRNVQRQQRHTMFSAPPPMPTNRPISTPSTRRPSPTTSSCTCRLWCCQSTTRRCARAASCTTRASSTPPTCETCSCPSSRTLYTPSRATRPPARHSKKTNPRPCRPYCLAQRKAVGKCAETKVRLGLPEGDEMHSGSRQCRQEVSFALDQSKNHNNTLFLARQDINPPSLSCATKWMERAVEHFHFSSLNTFRKPFALSPQ